MVHRKTKSVPWIAIGILTIAITTIGGCMGEATPPGSDPALNGTEWILSAYSADGRLAPVLNGTTITLQFREYTASGSAGCNHYFADYKKERSSIRFKSVGSTEMYCSEPGVMDQESRYLQLLGPVQQYTLEGDNLTLEAEKSAPLLTYTRKVPPEPRSLRGTSWTLESFTSGDAVSSVIAGTELTAVFSEDGRVMGSAGCNQYSADYTLNGSSLRIGPAIATKMYCTEPEGVMVQEGRYFGALESAAGYAVEGDRLSILDRNGQEVIVYRAEE